MEAVPLAVKVAVGLLLAEVEGAPDEREETGEQSGKESVDAEEVIQLRLVVVKEIDGEGSDGERQQK